MIWWISDVPRARLERQLVAELAQEVSWLKSLRWYFAEEAALTLDFELEHQSERFPMTMTYSAFHPNAPIKIVPKDTSRLSSHQYGAGGSLCLEYRADNWQTSYTGAMMLRSAYKLLSGEREENGPEILSAHTETMGQKARGQFLRFLLSVEAEACLRSIDVSATAPIKISEKFFAAAVATTLTDFGDRKGLGSWPPGIPETIQEGIAIRLPNDRTLPRATEQCVLSTLLELGLTELHSKVQSTGPDQNIIFVTESEIAHYQIFDVKNERVYMRATTLQVEDGTGRLPPDYASLATKRVGIIGCGSLGSKIASILARSGVRSFLLADDDLFLQDNLVRNELSARAIGADKVEAVKHRLIEISGTIDVTVKKLLLGGQESAGATEAAMASLAGCDLVLDATASPACFNFSAAIVKSALKPLVWGEVFAGGIGGLIARARPSFEPEPQEARNQILGWCESHGVPAPKTGGTGYDGSDTQGNPLVADDADVTVIAGQLARLCLDTLVPNQKVAFPYPAYAIGLRREWIFSEPLEIWPIELSNTTDWKAAESESGGGDAFEFFREIVPEKPNDHA